MERNARHDHVRLEEQRALDQQCVLIVEQVLPQVVRYEFRQDYRDVPVRVLLLQLLDDGRLTDGKGRTVDFKNTVVIMTSNLGSQLIADAGMTGLGGVRGSASDVISPRTREAVLDALRTHFRPEFLNRIDEIIFFHALGKEHLRRIVDIQVTALMKRLEERKIHVQLTDAAKEQLVREGYDPTYGARPLKRTIQRRVLDPLALRVLEGDFLEGDTVVVDAGADGLRFEKRETVRA